MPVSPLSVSLACTGVVQRRRRVAVRWLAIGSVLLIATPVSAWTALLGWGPALVLVVSPLVWLLVCDPGWPLRLVRGVLRPRRRVQAVWRGGRRRGMR